MRVVEHYESSLMLDSEHIDCVAGMATLAKLARRLGTNNRLSTISPSNSRYLYFYI